MTVDANKWWGSIATASDISNDLCTFVAHLQTCSSNTAAIERILSNIAVQLIRNFHLIRKLKDFFMTIDEVLRVVKN